MLWPGNKGHHPFMFIVTPLLGTGFGLYIERDVERVLTTCLCGRQSLEINIRLILKIYIVCSDICSLRSAALHLVAVKELALASIASVVVLELTSQDLM